MFTADAFRVLAQTHEFEEERRRAEGRKAALALRSQRMRELAERRLTDSDWRAKLHGAQRCAAQGLKEFMLIRFPAQLCSDSGRAINAPDPSWPSTLRGEPEDIFQRWRNELQPHGFRLAAQIVDFPDGVPGDAALYLLWSA